jgi:hypothetical protein
MLLTSEALLYADADTSWILMVPVLIFLYLPSLFLSYLKVNEEGIELLYWPSYRLKSSWDEISHLGNVTLLGKIPFDALYLKKSEQERGVSRHRGIRKKWIIPLGDFRGWPEGELYEQLQIYLPRFFESEKEDQSS